MQSMPSRESAARKSDHKREGDIDVVHPRCEVAECGKFAIYGPPGTKSRRFCSGHRREGDVDVVHPRCEVADCGKFASFGPPGGRPQYCLKHKLTDNVNLVPGPSERRRMADLKAKGPLPTPPVSPTL